MKHVSPIPSPRLKFCPATLPAAVYFDADWYAREMATVFARNWICVGRLADFATGTMRRAQVGAADVIVCRAADGAVSAYHNTCRHRGAELCRAAVAPLGKLIRCPYHAFAYAAEDGRLVATGHAVTTADFDRAAHGLLPVAVRVWAGFLFLNTGEAAGDLAADVDLGVLDHWPMEGLVTGHVWQAEIACNWKVFWENYSECLHCPGIHPELCDRVPIYARGIMAESEAVGWDGSMSAGNLKPGAESWTPTGAACGPTFPLLTQAERAAGFQFVTLWPTAYVVAHVDHVRAVRIVPLSPVRTALVVEWYFVPEVLAQPGFDAAAVAEFAKTVLRQDGEAAEMNQRGMMSPAYFGGTLMPEEYEIHRFHQWLLQEMEVSA